MSFNFKNALFLNLTFSCLMTFLILMLGEQA